MPALLLRASCALHELVQHRCSGGQLGFGLEGQVCALRQLVCHTVQGGRKHLAGWCLRAQAAEQVPLVRRRAIAATTVDGDVWVLQERCKAAASWSAPLRPQLDQLVCQVVQLLQREPCAE